MEARRVVEVFRDRCTEVNRFEWIDFDAVVAFRPL